MGVEYFSSNFLQEFLGLFKDAVGEVRVAAGESVGNMVWCAGGDYVADTIFPTVKALAADE